MLAAGAVRAVRGVAGRRGLASAAQLLRSESFLDGQWESSPNGRNFEVRDPGSGKQVATLPDLGASDCVRAIDAAERALPGWRATTGKQRCEILRKVFLLHREYEEELAEILASESGKPLAEARGEIQYGASYFEWFAEEAKRMYGDVIPPPMPGRRVLTFREPVGICGLITPWNFPNAMIARKAAPAIAAGCTVVIKPASETPLSTLAIARLFEIAGLPKGVINVVTGSSSAEIGKALTDDSRVRKISFTGSTRIGKLLLKASAESVKKVSMELGGNAPFIVFDDADLDAAVEGLIASKFRNNGQTCVCANRIFVQKGVYEEFAERFAERVASLKIGHYSDPEVKIGPLINDAAVAKVTELLEDAVSKGAKVLTGGKALPEKGSSMFFGPTVLTNCSDLTMRVGTEEIFGPIAPLFQFETEEEVISRANSTEAGLAAYFFSNNMQRCFRVSEALEAGMVGCNTGILSTEVAPFGGVKESGLGREGSKYGMDDYTELKYVAMQVA